MIGGGPVGAELAQAFATLGSDVTLLERESHILERDEPFAAEQVAAGLKADGVEVLTDVQAQSVARGEDGRVTVVTSTHGTLEADEILVASGRRHLTEDLGLEAVGMDGDRQADRGRRRPARRGARLALRRSVTPTASRC